MNISEANEINRLITAILEMRDQPLARTNEICTDALCGAMINLADRAHKTLMAGIDGDTVRNAWPKPDGWRYRP